MNNVIKLNTVPSYEKIVSTPEAKGFLRAHVRVMYGSGSDERMIYENMPDLEKRRLLRDMKDSGIYIEEKHLIKPLNFAISG